MLFMSNRQYQTIAMKHIMLCLLFALLVTAAGCDNGKPTPPVEQSAADNSSTVDVPYQPHGEHEYIQVSFNGVPFNMLFDTGASDTQLTAVDIDALVREGAVSQDDVLREDFYSIASGDVMKAVVLNISEVIIRGDNGRKLVFNDVEVCVAVDGSGSRLLGKNIINKLGDYEIDRSTRHMIFKAR